MFLGRQMMFSMNLADLDQRRISRKDAKDSHSRTENLAT